MSVDIVALAAEVNAELAVMNAPLKIGVHMLALKYALPVSIVYSLYSIYRKTHGLRMARKTLRNANKKTRR